MKIEISKNQIQQNKKSNQLNFKGPLDGIVTQALTTIETNEMVNAALVDVFSMVIPRTYVDTKERNKYAGAETLFRELTGTFIVCLSSGFIAKGISHLYNKVVEPKTNINPNSWVANDSLNLLKHSWDKSNNNVEKYVSNILSNFSGIDGKKTSEWKDIDWKNVEWLDDSKWDKINWQDSKFKNIQHNLKNEEQITKTLSQIIENKTIDKKDAKHILEIINSRITNALKVGNSIDVKLDDKKLSSSLKNITRDIYDLGKTVFTNKEINIEAALSKLQKMNKAKTLGALAVASTLGLTNQYINRQITKKRTGSDNFVGEVDYKKTQEGVSMENPQEKKNNLKLIVSKLLASAGIIGFAAAVMHIKNPKDFIKKLEFAGPITSGNAIKTVYTATLIGRFLAAKNDTELRESATRDYLGFLNWLVLGGFVSKGVGQLFFDKNLDNLFNVSGNTKGFKNWLNNFTPKSHAEIAAKSSEFAKKNIWKANVIQASGLVYSTVALGILIPLLNIAITKNKHKKAQEKPEEYLHQEPVPKIFESFGAKQI